MSRPRSKKRKPSLKAIRQSFRHLRHPEPQTLGTDTEWTETTPFVDAVKELYKLRTKPKARFVGKVPTAELREVAHLLLAVASAQERSTTEPAHAPYPYGRGRLADELRV